MTSVTSFFNGRVLRKDLTRYAPVWGIYALLTGIAVLGNLHGCRDEVDAANSLRDVLQWMSWGSLIYALICGVALFGDLFVPRLCYGLHALPLRREGWFLTHVTAGVVMSLVPNLVVALVCMPQLGEYWYAALVWLLGCQLQHLFFFGVACLCAMCAGNRLAMSLMYGIVNFGSLLAYALATLFYEPMLYGFRFRVDPFALFSPVVHLTTGRRDVFWFLEGAEGCGGFWAYLGAMGGLGLACLVGALLLYRRRHLEKAGDFIALRPVTYVFRVIYTLSAGLLVYFFGELFFGSADAVRYGFMTLGMIVGYFTAQMLLRRTLKVFRMRNLVGCGVLIGLLALSVFITGLDPFGVTTRVPEADQVVSVTYSGTYSGYYQGNSGSTTADPEEIAQLLEIHRLITETGAPKSQDTVGFSICYQLDNGWELERHYYLDSDSQATEEIRVLLSRPESVLGYSDWQRYVSSISLVEVYLEDGEVLEVEDQEQIQALLEALRQDCEDGRVVYPESYQQELGEYVAWLSLAYDSDSNYRYGMSIYSNYTLTTAWLQEYSQEVAE